MHWRLQDLLDLPVSYYVALGEMFEEDAKERP